MLSICQQNYRNWSDYSWISIKDIQEKLKNDLPATLSVNGQSNAVSKLKKSLSLLNTIDGSDFDCPDGRYVFDLQHDDNLCYSQTSGNWHIARARADFQSSADVICRRKFVLCVVALCWNITWSVICRQRLKAIAGTYQHFIFRIHWRLSVSILDYCFSFAIVLA